jgi:AcrR family transcriptional regulator
LVEQPFRILTVGSIRNQEDLTTRARIRDAALRLFPEHGFSGTTLRDVAREAGVSPGLVVHHFGSKEGLREACDQHVVALFRKTKLEAMEEGNINPAFAAAALDIAPQLMRYLGWALARSHPAAEELYDEMFRESLAVTRVAIGKGWMVDSPDIEMRTATQLTMHLGMSVLHSHFQRATGVDPHTREGVAAMMPVLLEMFAGMFHPEILEKLKAAYGNG